MKHALRANEDRWDWIVHCTLGLCAFASVVITFAAVGRVLAVANRVAGLRVHGQHFVLQLEPDKSPLGDARKAQLAHDNLDFAATNRTSAQAPNPSRKASIGG